MDLQDLQALAPLVMELAEGRAQEIADKLSGHEGDPYWTVELDGQTVNRGGAAWRCPVSLTAEDIEREVLVADGQVHRIQAALRQAGRAGRVAVLPAWEVEADEPPAPPVVTPAAPAALVVGPAPQLSDPAFAFAARALELTVQTVQAGERERSAMIQAQHERTAALLERLAADLTERDGQLTEALTRQVGGDARVLGPLDHAVELAKVAGPVALPALGFAWEALGGLDGAKALAARFLGGGHPLADSLRGLVDTVTAGVARKLGLDDDEGEEEEAEAEAEVVEASDAA